jgi:hypothetical protein
MSSSLLRRLTDSFLPRSKPKRPQVRKSSRLRLESLEDRRLMAGFHTAVLDNALNHNLTVLQLPTSQGSITYNANTKAVTVEGSNNHGDLINVRIDNRGTATIADDLVAISVSNLNGTLPLRASYNYSAVNRVFAHGLGGNDTIQNDTIVAITSYGGPGRDVLIGGYGHDALLGGDDNDYIDGRRGSDMIWGENGHDGLFGDDGYDTILGGAGYDYIFGGNHDDYLYGEGDNDRLYGGAGIDSLNDTTGINVYYTDYGPDYTVSASGYTAFDWFDKNLTNPDLRSRARLEFRDGVLGRNDMLNIYTTVSSDNYVSTSELNDLKTLLSTRINMPADSRYFANMIANGDRANQWYRGGTLGNLYAGASGAHLSKLADKWFKGGDLPGIEAGFHYEYAYGQLFVNGPNYTDVDQGSASDCYFLAALGETAQHRPSIIQNMFGSNGDGTFVVRFVTSGVTRYVTVNRYLPARNDGTAAYAGWGSTMNANGTFVGNQFNNSNNELWVALAEKAYAQLNESGVIGQDGTNTYVGIDFGNTGKAFGHITGKNGAFYDLSQSGIINAQNAGKAISLSTKDSGVAAGIVANHAYMLVGYNSGTGLFELFNPHGFVTGGNTVLQLTWSQIVASFDGSTSVLL